MFGDIRILFIDDEPVDVMFEQHELTRHGIAFASRIAVSEPELVEALSDFKPDVVLCDYSMPGFSGARALDTVRRLRPATPVLLVSGSIPDDTAVECLNWGAIDYILKSNLRRLGPAVRRAVTDTRQRLALEARIDELSRYDAITGLPNLQHLHPAVEHVFERVSGRGSSAALVVVNLDHFRYIDERFGREVADRTLRELGALLKGQPRPLELVARIGPNEFLLVLSDLADGQQASDAVHRQLSAIAAPRHLAGREVRISASAGLALYPADGEAFEDLLCKATAAMHEAKAVSPGALQFHSGDVVQHARARRRLEAALREAIQGAELTLAYQPQFDIRSGVACGVEALARWHSAPDASVPPSVFIPLAEQAGLIGSLGEWALRTSCRTAADWARQRLAAPPVSVNVSAYQIREEFTGEIAEALERSGLEAGQLELEITESVLVTNIDLALKCLAQWKRLGVRIALDDFGTGYSSLGYLARLPIDRLKIDGSLVRGMTSRSKDTTIVRAVISLGRELGFTVLAEGVENEAQLSLLRELGCEQAQGYLMTPPTSAAEANVLMGRPWGARAALLSAPRMWQ
jgi:diguanylate cyclase (GGDEF)-like protein